MTATATPTKAQRTKWEREARQRDSADTDAAEAGAADARAGKPKEAPFGVDPAIYEFGYDAELEDQAAATKSKKGPARSSSRSAKPGTAGGSKGGAKRSNARRPPARRRRNIARRSASNATNQILRPAERQLTSGLAVIGTAGLIAISYNFLVNAKEAGTAIDAVVRAITWIDNPKSIPYKKN